MTDNWLEKGYPWETAHPESRVLVRFGGDVVRHEDADGTFSFTTEGGELVAAIPYDVPIVGYGGKTVNRLRLWSAQPAGADFDLDAFNAGDYARANKFRTDAEAISEILYPNDAGEHGRILRLKQEYLFVSAGLTSILRTFKFDNGPDAWDRFPDLVAIHTNDTHPAMCGAELMRLFMDEEEPGLGHRMGPRHPLGLLHEPHRPSRSAREVAHRHVPPPPAARLHDHRRDQPPLHGVLPPRYRGLAEKMRNTAILWDGQVRMANLSVICSHFRQRRRPADTPKSSSARRCATSTSSCRRSSTTRPTASRRAVSSGNANPSLSALITERIGDGSVPRRRGAQEARGLRRR